MGWGSILGSVGKVAGDLLDVITSLPEGAGKGTTQFGVIDFGLGTKGDGTPYIYAVNTADTESTVGFSLSSIVAGQAVHETLVTTLGPYGSGTDSYDATSDVLGTRDGGIVTANDAENAALRAPDAGPGVTGRNLMASITGMTIGGTAFWSLTGGFKFRCGVDNSVPGRTLYFVDWVAAKPFSFMRLTGTSSSGQSVSTEVQRPALTGGDTDGKAPFPIGCDFGTTMDTFDVEIAMPLSSFTQINDERQTKIFDHREIEPWQPVRPRVLV